MKNRLDPTSSATTTTGRRMERSYVAPKKIKSAYDIVAQSYGERQPKQSKAAVLNGLLPDSISLGLQNNKNITNTNNSQQYYGYNLPLQDNQFSKNTDDSYLYSTADGSNNTQTMSINTGIGHKNGSWNTQLDDKENQNWMSNQIDEDQGGIRQDDRIHFKKSNKMFKSIEGLDNNWNQQQNESQMYEGTSKGSNVAVEASSKSSRASTYRSNQQQQYYQLGQQSRQEFIEHEAAIEAENINNNQNISVNEVQYQQRGYPIKKNDYLIMEEQKNHNNNHNNNTNPLMNSTSGISKANNNAERYSIQRDRRASFEAQPRMERSKTGDSKGSSSLRQLSAQVSQRLSQSLQSNAGLFTKSSGRGGVSREMNSLNNIQGSQRNYQNRTNNISNSLRQSGLSYQQNESLIVDSQRYQGELNRSSNQVNSKSTSRIQQQQQHHNITKKKQQAQQQQILERENQVSYNNIDTDKETIQRLKESVHQLQIRDASHRLEASKLKKIITELRQDLELSKQETATARTQADTDAEYIRQLDGQLSVYAEKLETLQKALDRQIRESSEETRGLMNENEELRKQIDDLEGFREEAQRKQQQEILPGGYGQGQGVMEFTNEQNEVDGNSCRNSNYENQGDEDDDDDGDDGEEYEDNEEECDCEECNNNNNDDTYSQQQQQQQQYSAIPLAPPSLSSSHQLKDPQDCSYLPFQHEIITEQAEEDEQSSRVNIHSTSHLSQAQSTAKMININLQALWNSSRVGNNNNTGCQNQQDSSNLGDFSALLQSSMIVNSKKGNLTQTGRSISQQLLTQQQQQQNNKQSKSSVGNQQHLRNSSNNNHNIIENHRNLSITSPCDNNSTSICGINSSKCNSLPDYLSQLSSKATPASQMIVSDCGDYSQNDESQRQLQGRENSNIINQGCQQIIQTQNNNNNKIRHLVDRYQDHQNEEDKDNNSQYGIIEGNDNENNQEDEQDSMRDLVQFQVNYQDFLNQADTTQDHQDNQNKQHHKNSNSYDYWKRHQLQQQHQQHLEATDDQKQQLQSHENINDLAQKQFSTWKDSNNFSRMTNNHNNSHNSSSSWENNNNVIIDPNEFIEDNLLHNNSSADVNCTE